MSTFKLNVMGISKTIYSGDIVMMVAPSVEGEIGILPGHAPIVAKLHSGLVRIFLNDRSKCDVELTVNSGFLVVSDNVCDIYCFDDRAESL